MLCAFGDRKIAFQTAKENASLQTLQSERNNLACVYIYVSASQSTRKVKNVLFQLLILRQWRRTSLEKPPKMQALRVSTILLFTPMSTLSSQVGFPIKMIILP